MVYVCLVEKKKEYIHTSVLFPQVGNGTESHLYIKVAILMTLITIDPFP